MKDLEQLLRELPVMEPPSDLQHRIQDTLPSHHGVAGWTTYCLTRELSRRVPTGKKRMLLPSDPAEYGLTILGVGVFFMSILAVTLPHLYPIAASADANGLLLVLAPSMVGALLLIMGGWMQLWSPKTLIAQPLRLGTVGVLFGVTIILGALFSGQQIVSMVGSWLGFSGLLVTIGLVLIPKISLLRQEPFYAKNTCAAR